MLPLRALLLFDLSSLARGLNLKHFYQYPLLLYDQKFCASLGKIANNILYLQTIVALTEVQIINDRLHTCVCVCAFFCQVSLLTGGLLVCYCMRCQPVRVLLMLEDMTCLIRALKTISSKVSCHIAGGLHVQLRVFAIIFLFHKHVYKNNSFLLHAMTSTGGGGGSQLSYEICYWLPLASIIIRLSDYVYAPMHLHDFNLFQLFLRRRYVYLVLCQSKQLR